MNTAIQDDQVILLAIDTGSGISGENFSKASPWFWSTEGVTTGTGLVLPVSHGITIRHGGTISVEAEEGKDAAFTVRPPLAKELQKGAMPPGDQPLRLKLNVLLIDDMPPILLLLDRILSKHGQTVLSATSGEESLEIFRNNRTDLVICDLGMPGMNGWEVGKAIRMICQDRGIPKTPFILLTGWPGQALEKEKILESGVDAVVEKPLDSRRLMASVREVVERVVVKESK